MLVKSIDRSSDRSGFRVKRRIGGGEDIPYADGEPQMIIDAVDISGGLDREKEERNREQGGGSKGHTHSPMDQVKTSDKLDIVV